MDSIWELNEMRGKNPVHTGQFFTSYDPRGFTQEEVVAREGCQNSMDAGKDVKGITQVEFHELKIDGEEKSELLSLFEFDNLLAPRLEAFKENAANEFFANSVGEFLTSDELDALLIRDHNTCGLGGAWEKYEPGDHFSRLVCSLNLGDKADDDPNSGGSFGLGKTAYAKSSKINTVIYHSTFKEDERTEGVSRRLMVAGVFPQHKFGDQVFGGFAYFGKKDSLSDSSARPFENEEALELWTKITSLFGIDARRGSDEYGTDILVLMSDVEIAAVKKATEDYYFPAIIEGTVNISFFDQRGHQDYPKPYERKDLDQFIRLVKFAKRNEDEVGDTKEFAKLNAYQGLQLGRIAFEAAEEDEAISTKANCIALMRGTGMIINYVKLGSENYESAVGAFVAHDDVWDYLKMAENAAHSEWEPNARKLRQKFPEFGKELVESLNNRLGSRFSQFQKRLQPDVSSTRSESGLLARLLSSALAGGAGDLPPPDGTPNPVSISLTKKQRDTGASTWRLLVQSNEHTPESPFSLKLLPAISAAGEKMVPIKNRDFIVTKSDGEFLAQGQKPEIDYQFRQGMVIDLNVTFNDPGNNNYVVRCKFVATMGATNEL